MSMKELENDFVKFDLDEEVDRAEDSPTFTYRDDAEDTIVLYEDGDIIEHFYHVAKNDAAKEDIMTNGLLCGS